MHLVMRLVMHLVPMAVALWILEAPVHGAVTSPQSVTRDPLLLRREPAFLVLLMSHVCHCQWPSKPLVKQTYQ